MYRLLLKGPLTIVIFVCCCGCCCCCCHSDAKLAAIWLLWLIAPRDFNNIVNISFNARISIKVANSWFYMTIAINIVDYIKIWCTLCKCAVDNHMNYGLVWLTYNLFAILWSQMKMMNKISQLAQIWSINIARKFFFFKWNVSFECFLLKDNHISVSSHHPIDIDGQNGKLIVYKRRDPSTCSANLWVN